MGNCIGPEFPHVDVSKGFPENDPQESEVKDTCDEIKHLTERSQKIIKQLESYDKSLQKLIKQSLQSPSDKQLIIETYDKLLPNLLVLKEYFEIYQSFESLSLKMINGLNNEGIPPRSCLLHNVINLLSISILLDKMKMNNPDLSNDFFYYRRTMNKIQNDRELPINEQDSSKISLMIGEYAPINRGICNALANSKKGVDVLITMTNYILSYVELHPSENMEIFLNALTTITVLVDNLHPGGSFGNNSPIPTIQIVNLLIDYNQDKSLLKILKSISLTYHTTNSSVKKSIEKHT